MRLFFLHGSAIFLILFDFALSTQNFPNWNVHYFSLHRSWSPFLQASCDASFLSVVLRRYSSRPPILLILLSTLVVSFTLRLWPSASLNKCFFTTFGFHFLRVLFPPSSLTLFPNCTRFPPKRPRWARLGPTFEQDLEVDDNVVVVVVVLVVLVE